MSSLQRRASDLFRDYAAAFKGAKQVTYSHGFRDDARSDEEIAAAEVGETIGFLPARIYSRVMFLGLGAAILDVAEDGGWRGVVAYLRGLGLYWDDPYASDNWLARSVGLPLYPSLEQAIS